MEKNYNNRINSSVPSIKYITRLLVKISGHMSINECSWCSILSNMCLKNEQPNQVPRFCSGFLGFSRAPDPAPVVSELLTERHPRDFPECLLFLLTDSLSFTHLALHYDDLFSEFYDLFRSFMSYFRELLFKYDYFFDGFLKLTFLHTNNMGIGLFVVWWTKTSL